MQLAMGSHSGLKSCECHDQNGVLEDESVSEVQGRWEGAKMVAATSETTEQQFGSQVVISPTSMVTMRRGQDLYLGGMLSFQNSSHVLPQFCPH